MWHLYHRVDRWLRGLPRYQYALFFGLSGGVGVLLAGLLVSDEFLILQAGTMALVMFGLEAVFGLHQTGEG
ncbi:hypothetical protein [Haloarchaeobius amylolyticus]|uniref:hypothetical protein n=1 Tax=Haloarchaeobius amylolyticus TaxID=1198296 RepID=UPI0022712EAD|nr:hypothetical protein [Haloarchaeobius amylolyticus]